MELGNGVSFVGRLVRDIEIMEKDGKKFTSFSLARNRRKADKNAEDVADFIDFVAFGSNAEFAEKYFKKGTKMGVYGRLTTKMWEKDGVKGKNTSVIVDGFEFMESGNSSSRKNENNNEEKKETVDEPVENDDDLPF